MTKYNGLLDLLADDLSFDGLQELYLEAEKFKQGEASPWFNFIKE
jgi:hypothetical protein